MVSLDLNKIFTQLFFEDPATYDYRSSSPEVFYRTIMLKD